MTAMRKIKISVSLAPEIVARVDKAAAAEPGATRSGIVERWLRQADRAAVTRKVEADVIAYYDSMTAEHRREEKVLSEALGRAASELDIDGNGPRAKRARVRSRG